MTQARRILIADDEAPVRDAFHAALKPIAAPNAKNLDALEGELFGTPATAKGNLPNYDLTMVAQGADAIDAVRRSLADNKPFSVVFLDMRMPPGIGGLETAKQIRAIDPALNIILVTGYSDIDVCEVAKDVPPTDKLFFIAKPFHVSEIRQQAAALSARWRHESALLRELQTQNQALEFAAIESRLARNEAEKANIAKSAFLANVSHELRTPLNAVIGFSDVMVEQIHGPLGDERYLDYTKQINVSGRGLLDAINDIIDTARLDIGTLELTQEHFDAKACVTRAALDLQEQAGANAVTLEIPQSQQNFDVIGDRRRLQQVLTAVMRNAVMFSPRGGRVDVTVERHDGETVIAIRDAGPGMSAALIEAVQRPFSQGESHLSRNHGGLGLNLALAKRLVELHAGRLEILSAPGKGTTVRICLPAAPALANAAATNAA